MWTIAGNVYKQWCKKRASNRQCELTDSFFDKSYEASCPLSADPTANWLTDPDYAADDQLYLLRRELTLLSVKYRQVTILYYLENRSCQEIAQLLSLSESMVKYLLFKSRQILKDGMSMERNYGQQSYNPKGLQLHFWGNGFNRYGSLLKSKISQNILFACYNDKLTAEQISLEIGVALPYMEDKLAELFEYDLLKKDGKRYYTNIAIFTTEFMMEVSKKTAVMQSNIASLIKQAIETNEASIRALGFYGSDMDANSFRWQMTSLLLQMAIIETLQKQIHFVFPVDKFGTECYLWGVEDHELFSEKARFSFGRSEMENAAGDHIQFMDFGINGEMVHHYIFNRQNITNIFLDIARGDTSKFSENDLAAAADMVRKGYVCSDQWQLLVNAPVLSAKQYQELTALLTPAASLIAQEAKALMDTVTGILKNHIPVHLKKQAQDLAYLRLFQDAIAAPVAWLTESSFLVPYTGIGMLPTTFVILK